MFINVYPIQRKIFLTNFYSNISAVWAIKATEILFLVKKVQNMHIRPVKWGLFLRGVIHKGRQIRIFLALSLSPLKIAKPNDNSQ